MVVYLENRVHSRWICITVYAVKQKIMYSSSAKTKECNVVSFRVLFFITNL
jgi:hypothetical protein